MRHGAGYIQSESITYVYYFSNDLENMVRFVWFPILLIVLTPVSVTYEDFAVHYEEITKHILKFMGITAPDPLEFGERLERKIADEINEDWVQRFRKEKQTDWRYKGW